MEETQAGAQALGISTLPQPSVPEVTCSIRLSEKDEAEVLAAAQEPPEPNEAAVKAARRFIQRHG